MRTRPSIIAFIGLSALLWAACSEDAPPPKPVFPASSALTVGVEQRGLPLELNRSYSANRVKYESMQGDVSALFIYEQIYSEYVDATEGSAGRPELHDRLDDLYEDFEDELARYDTHYVVVDLQRRDRTWLVDWDGLSRDEPGNTDNFHFGDAGDRRRTDYWPAVSERLVEVVQRFVPHAIIIGMEMNRYYDQNPGDWANFVEFYWTMVDAVKAANPNVRVAAGINWSHLVDRQVASFLQEGDLVEDVAPFERAYDAIVDPLINRYDADGNRVGGSDFAAFAAIPDPSLHGAPANVPDRHFASLIRVLPSGTVPIVWFQVGWPVSSDGSGAPGQFYEYFLAHAGGTTTERVSWYGLTHLLGGDCTPLTGSMIGASQTVCFRGLFSDSGAPTSLSEVYFGGEE